MLVYITGDAGTCVVNPDHIVGIFPHFHGSRIVLVGGGTILCMDTSPREIGEKIAEAQKRVDNPEEGG